MKDVILETGVPWNREQTEKSLDKLEDNPVKLTLVLNRFAPHHVHLTREGFWDVGWVWRLATYLRTQALPDAFDNPTHFSQERSLWSVKKTLGFRKIDFAFRVERPNRRFGISFINTTKLEGSQSLYQVFTPFRFREYDYSIHGKGQQLITAMLEARV